MIQDPLFDHAAVITPRVGAADSHRTSLFDRPHGDYFAGWGGATLGFEQATGRTVDFCVNHCEMAIKFHEINHPNARHFISDVNDVDIDDVLDAAAGSLWFSPDCRHFSPARGSAPVSKKVRSLAWVVPKCARAKHRPDVMFVENVPAFLSWGPIRQAKDTRGKLRFDEKGRPWMVPIESREGETFRKWVSSLEKAGYVVDWKVIDAAELGVPQHRKRLFIIARCDGKPILWPVATHGPADSGLKPYHTAAECIDWTLPCPSIFMTAKEGRAFKKATGIQVQRPLADNTLRRSAMGILRYTLENPRPFIVRCAHGGDHFRGQPTDKPMSAVTGSNDYAVAMPSVINIERSQNPFVGGPITNPLGTVTASPKGGKHAILSPSLATIGYGERDGQAPRTRPVEAPMNSVVGSGNGGKAGIVEPVLVGMGGSGYAAKPRSADRPAGVVKCHDRRGVVMPIVTQFNSNPDGSVNHGHDPRQPSSTVACRGPHQGILAPVLVASGGPKRGPGRPNAPLHAVMTREHSAIVSPTLIRTDMGTANAPCVYPPDSPVRTVTSGGGHALNNALLVKFRGTSVDGAPIDGPAPAIGAGGQHESIASVQLVRMNHGDKQWNSVTEPCPAITTGGTKGLTFAVLMRYHSSGGQWSDPSKPSTTVTAMEGKGVLEATCERAADEWPVPMLNTAMKVAAFMRKYAGEELRSDLARAKKKLAAAKQSLKAKIATRIDVIQRRIAKLEAHFAPIIDESGKVLGEVLILAVEGVMHLMADVGLRMFTPRELARCQSFPDAYVLPDNKATAVRLIGNSVPPKVVEALVRANLPEMCMDPARARQARRRRRRVAVAA